MPSQKTKRQTMSQERQDNCLLAPIRLPDDLPLRDECSQNTGRSLPPPVDATNVQAPARVRASRRAMQFFVPRPFPPPSLANVPVEYILDQLHNLAPHYWSKPETADCTIIIPLDGLLRQTGQASRSYAPHAPQCAAPMSKRQTPLSAPAPRMVMKVHSDYLSAHSTLLRSIFSEGYSLDVPDSPTSRFECAGSSFHLPLPSKSPSPSPSPSTYRGLPIAPRYPRLLPSSPSHPTVYLPVPDPTSFRLLVHYMYFWSTDYIEAALDSGAVTWEGIARNVEYLGMDMEIKVCLGRGYRRWQRARMGHGIRAPVADEFDDYSDSDEDSFFDSDDEEMEQESVTTASDGEDDRMQIDECVKRAPLDVPRGRPRTPRRLGHAISDPGPIRVRKPHTTFHASQSSSPSSRGMTE